MSALRSPPAGFPCRGSITWKSAGRCAKTKTAPPHLTIDTGRRGDNPTRPSQFGAGSATRRRGGRRSGQIGLRPPAGIRGYSRSNNAGANSRCCNDRPSTHRCLYVLSLRFFGLPARSACRPPAVRPSIITGLAAVPFGIPVAIPRG
jgi:hypothetical protein